MIWEYKVLVMDFRWNQEAQEKAMNELGKYGWELRQIIASPDGWSVTAYFRRHYG